MIRNHVQLLKYLCELLSVAAQNIVYFQNNQ
jgi:hypothetical protein